MNVSLTDFTQNLNWRTIPIHLGIIATFLMLPSWKKLPDAPDPFTATYVTGFLILLPMLWTIGWWLLAGLPGLRELLQNKLRIIWAGALLLLLFWSFLSQSWAFAAENYSGVAQNATLQLTLTIAFTLVLACTAPSPRNMIAILVLILGWNAFIGALQVAQQGSIGLQALGEFDLNPALSGVGVIQSGDIRWLRPYGLLPHPNIFAGVIAVGLLASIAWIARVGASTESPEMQQTTIGDDPPEASSFLPRIRGRWRDSDGGGLLSNALNVFQTLRWDKRLVPALIFLGGLWVLLLTFSRGAWGSFGLSILLILPLMFRKRLITRWLLVVGGMAILAGIGFLLMYQPLIASRAGIGEESIEMRSVADRIVFTEIAFAAIQERPIMGLGGGNFPWYAGSYLFHNTDYDLRGDNVHNVALGIWTEYGIVGLTLLVVSFGTGVLASLRNILEGDQPVERIMLLAGFIALTVVGILDHYPWTMIHTQVLWFGLLAVGIMPRQPLKM